MKNPQNVLRDLNRALRALLIGTAIGLPLFYYLGIDEGFPIAFLVVMIIDSAAIYVLSHKLTIQGTRAIFANWHPSRSVLVERTVLLAFMSILLVSLCIKNVKEASILPQNIRVFIYFAALFVTWLQLNNGFAIYYAKKYFQLNSKPAADTGNPQGFVFAGTDEPVFSDFLYVSYAVGLTYAMSDTNLEDSSIRRMVLFHSVVSFLFYSTVITAILNLLVSIGD